jgi:hypothetical protein
MAATCQRGQAVGSDVVVSAERYYQGNPQGLPWPKDLLQLRRQEGQPTSGRHSAAVFKLRIAKTTGSIGIVVVHYAAR